MSILLSLLACLFSPPLAQDPAPPLDAPLLFAHPGFDAGDPDRVRDDWMRALAAAPDSPLAGIAARLLDDLAERGWCSAAPDPARTAALLAGARDPEARFWLRSLHERALAATRFADARAPAPEDPWSDCVGHFLLLGPCGDVAEPEPLLHAAPGLPHLDLRAALASAGHGGAPPWRPLHRRHGVPYLEPAEHLFPATGSAYLLAFVQADPGPAVLEIRSHDRYVAWWNEAPALTVLRHALAEGESVHRARVAFAGGWNSVLLRCEPGFTPTFTVRLLRPDGSALPFRIWDSAGFPELPPPAATPLPEPIVEPLASGDGWERVLAAAQARLGGRPDRALALPGPEGDDPRLLRAWLHGRWSALQASWHLPADVKRARLLALEQELSTIGPLPPDVTIARARRLLREDRPTDALAAADAALAAAPGFAPFHLLRCDALAALDDRGVQMRAALAEARARLPLQPQLAARTARALEDAGCIAAARAASVAAVRLGADALDQALRLLLEGPPEGRALAARWVDAALAERPEDPGYLAWQRRWWTALDRDDTRLAELRARAEAEPWLPDLHFDLGRLALALGRSDEGVAALRCGLALKPGDPEARRLLERLGQPADRAEEFFAAFAPDLAGALAAAAATPAGDASTALLLDHGMVFVLADGSFQFRTNAVQLALDRNGTEAMHERSSGEEPRHARVVQSDGTVFEPHLVEGTWVFPELDPGDAVDVEDDRFQPSVAGLPADFGSWRFASFDEPFLLSRLVVHLPHGLPGDFRHFQFDGEHEAIPWHAGTVHIFTRRNSVRLEPETLQPSEDEILPWVVFGEDQETGRHLRTRARDLRRRATPPEDVAVELDAFLAQRSLPQDLRARAEAIYAAVGEYLLEFGSGDVTDAWSLRRGDARLLLAALYERAGVPFAWALTEPMAPELDPEPLRPFASGASYAVPALRLDLPGGEPVWLFAAARGAPFGAITAAQMGARALVLEADGGARAETLGSAALTSTWDLDFEATYRLGDGTEAAASGRIAIPGAQGGEIRQNILDLEPAQRDQVARQICGQFVAGLDLAEYEFEGLETAGAPFTMRFEGRVPDFLRRSGEDFGARLGLPELGLAAGFGPAERTRPLAFRSSLRFRARVRIESGDARRIEYVPRTRIEEWPGFRYAFEVSAEARTLQVERTVELRGFRVEAADFPAFLNLLREFEQQEKRAARIVAVSEAEGPR